MNEQDKLEQFIRDHREEFDGREPAPAVWAALEKEISPRKAPGIIRPLQLRWLKVAVVVLVAGGGLLLLRARQHTPFAGRPGYLPTQLAEAQDYYSRKIENRIAYIRSLPGGQESLPPETLKMMGNDDAYRQIEEALRENPGDGRVQAAFVQYYRSRLEVLDRITNTILNLQEEKVNDHEKTNSI